MKNPVILYCCKGTPYLYYAVWSIRSLQRFAYEQIEVIVSNSREREFLLRRCPGITCNEVDVSIQGYPSFSYKPFILMEYLKRIGIQHRGRRIVISDVDVLWKQNPVPLFDRFGELPWVHKITAVNPNDYIQSHDQIPRSNIGLRTIQNYARYHPLTVYPNFIVNAGLFMLPEAVFAEMLDRWMHKILSLPPQEMLMSEALMSLTYAEMGISPMADGEDIKHLGIEQSRVDLAVFSFTLAPEHPKELASGYETATHYYGDQRPALIKDAIGMGVDPDNLRRRLRRTLWVQGIRHLAQRRVSAVHRLATVGSRG